MIASLLDRLILAFERHATTPDAVNRAARILEWAVGRRMAGSTVEDIQVRRLRQTLLHAGEHSPFYKAMFQRVHFNPSNVVGSADLQKLPFTTSDQIRDWRQFLCIPEEQVGAVFTTSGTTGEPKRLYFSLEDMQVLSNWGAVTLRFRHPGKLVGLIALPVSHGLWSGSATAQRIVERAGGLPLAVGAADPQETLTWMKRFEPNLVISSPSFMTALTRYAQRTDYRCKIDRILLSGEPLSEDQKKHLTDYWGAEICDSYGTTELGGGQSMAFPGCDAFHLSELHLVTEIINPETGEPAEQGEMVFTTLVRQAMPLIRYRSGDRGRWAKCRCGLPFRSVQIFGRTDDMIVAGDMNLYGKVIAEVISKVSGASGRIEIVLEKIELVDRMSLRIDGESVNEEQVRQAIFAAFPEMEGNIANGNLLFEINPNVDLSSQLKALRIRDNRLHGEGEAVFDCRLEQAEAKVERS